MNGLETFQLEAAAKFRSPKDRPGEGLRQRIELLEPADRLLVELAASRGTSHRRIAGMLGVEPGTVSRRLRTIGGRLHDPVVARLMEPRCPLGPDYRQIGVEHFLVGRSVAQIAARMRRSHASVRQALDQVRAWHRLTRAVDRETIAS